MKMLFVVLVFTCLSSSSAMNWNGINPRFLELLRYLSQHSGQFPNFPNSMNFPGQQQIPQTPQQPAQPQQPPVQNQQATTLPQGTTQPPVQPQGTTQPTVQPQGTTQPPVQPQGTTQPPVQPQGTTQPPVQSQQGSNQASTNGQSGSTQLQQFPLPATGSGLNQGLPVMPSMPYYPPARRSPNLALMAAIRRQVALAYRMGRKYTQGQVIPPMGNFPGGVVISADGSDATVRGRFGLMDIDSFQFCPTEFNCMVVL